MIVQLVKAALKNQIQKSLTFTLPKVRVKVNQGIVKGVIESLPDGRNFQRFTGIPFAHPPIGELRFRAPQKLMKFDNDEIDCTTERCADQCFQKSLFYKVYVGSEDCLKLNVYVPNDISDLEKLPVMVYLFGGAFQLGSNSRELCSPEFLLMENVIVVTLNYRLHFLGFSYIPEMGIYGNAGLKDQQMGLEWVHENIEYFGGDRDNVTLFGNSAGAVSTHLHSLNKKSRKYFNKMILQSSNAIAEWILQENPREKMKRLVQRLNGRTLTPKDTYECLMKTDARKLFDNRLKVFEDYEKRRYSPTFMKPVIEVESDEAFLTKLPSDILREEGASIKIPMIHGMNNGDGFPQIEFSLKKTSMEKIVSGLIPMTLNLEHGTMEYLNFAKEMKEFYFGKEKLTKDSMQNFNDLCNDLHYTIPITMMHDLYKNCGSPSKQFVYSFEIESQLNFAKSFSNLKHLTGAYHTDELPYLFDYKIFGLNFNEESIEWKYRQMMCRMWTNFAKFTDPTPKDDKLLTHKWDPVDAKFNYLQITNHGNFMRHGLYENRVDFWREAFDKYNGAFIQPKYQIFT